MKMREIEKNTMGARIRECRKAAGMTQETLAEKLCCKKSLISQYENNKVDIKGSVIVELAKVLSSTAGYLLNEDKSFKLDPEEAEMIALLKKMKNPKMMKVALEQVRVLACIDLS